jgi:hypothetical protein
MAVVSLAVIRYLGEGLTGLAAAGVAALAVYAPVVYPMRKLIRKAPPDDDGSQGEGRHRRLGAPERPPPNLDGGPEPGGEAARLPTSG